MTNDLTVTTNAAPAALNPTTVLAMIERVAGDATFDLDRMDRLIQMHQALEAKQARSAYVDALARAQAAFPDVGKLGKSHHGQYGRWEDIHKAITPALATNGIALSFAVNTEDPKRIAVMAIARHKDGHEERGDWVWLPIDTSGNKNPAQQVGSTMSYGKRYAAGFVLNFRIGGEDTDANPVTVEDATPISDDQAERIQRALEFLDVAEDAFLRWCASRQIEADTIADIPASRFDLVNKQLQVWADKRAKQEAGE